MKKGQRNNFRITIGIDNLVVVTNFMKIIRLIIGILIYWEEANEICY